MNICKWILRSRISKRSTKTLRLFQLLVLGAIVSVLAQPLVATAYINISTQNLRYLQPVQVPQERVGIVFGAGLLQNGQPTPFLASRITAAVELYHLDRVQKLLMTGDSSRTDYNEVRSMQEYAHNLGVPMQDITLDYAGFSTYESCYTLNGHNLSFVKMLKAECEQGIKLFFMLQMSII